MFTVLQFYFIVSDNEYPREKFEITQSFSVKKCKSRAGQWAHGQRIQ